NRSCAELTTAGTGRPAGQLRSPIASWPSQADGRNSGANQLRVVLDRLRDRRRSGHGLGGEVVLTNLKDGVELGQPENLTHRFGRVCERHVNARRLQG